MPLFILGIYEDTLLLIIRTTSKDLEAASLGGKGANLFVALNF